MRLFYLQLTAQERQIQKSIWEKREASRQAAGWYSWIGMIIKFVSVNVVAQVLST